MNETAGMNQESKEPSSNINNCSVPCAGFAFSFACLQGFWAVQSGGKPDTTFP